MEKESENTLSPRQTSLPVPAGMDRPISTPATTHSATQWDPHARSPEMGPLSGDYHPKFAEEIHQYIREYIRNADQKAAFIFTVSTALIVYLKNKEALSLCVHFKWSSTCVVAVLAIIGLTMCAGLSLFVVFPRRSGSKRGIIFFDAIVEHESGRDYATDVFKHTLSDLLNMKLAHCYDLAKVCRLKYDILHIAFWSLAVGIGATVGFLFFYLPNL